MTIGLAIATLAILGASELGRLNRSSEAKRERLMPEEFYQLRSGGLVTGSEYAAVQLVLISDLRCEECDAADSILDEIQRTLPEHLTISRRVASSATTPDVQRAFCAYAEGSGHEAGTWHAAWLARRDLNDTIDAANCHEFARIVVDSSFVRRASASRLPVIVANGSIYRGRIERRAIDSLIALELRPKVTKP